jgi:hypothetical protein
MDGEDGIEQTKTTSETTKTDEKPFVLNESKRTIHCKPENTDEPFPLSPGQKTYDIVDGINVRGKVYKVPDGYSSVTVNANFSVRMDYSNSYIWYATNALINGGRVTRSDFKKDDHGWDKLFNIKK